MDAEDAKTRDRGCFRRARKFCHQVRTTESSLAWLVLLVHIISAGVPAAYVLPGIYVPTFVELYDCTLEEASWTVSVGYSSLCAAGVLMHPIEKRFGRIIPAAVAILTTACGTAFIPFYKNIWINVVCFGCLSGFGQGFMVFLSYRMIRDYFTTLYGLSFGVMTATVGVFASIYPILIYRTQTQFGVVTSCFIMGSVILFGMTGVGVMVIIKYLEGRDQHSSDQSSTLSVKCDLGNEVIDSKPGAEGSENDFEDSNKAGTSKDVEARVYIMASEETNAYQYGTWQLYRRFLSMGMFWVMSVTFLTTVIVLTILQGLLFDMMLFRGISKRTASLYYTIMNGGGTVGKLYLGYLLTLKCSGRFIAAVCLISLSMICLGLGLARNFVLIGSLAGAAGMFNGMLSSTAVILYQEAVPIAFRNDFASFGYSVMGLLSVFATPIAALLEDNFGYSASMYFTGACCVLGLIPLMGLKAVELYQRIVLRIEHPSTVAKVF